MRPFRDSRRVKSLERAMVHGGKREAASAAFELGRLMDDAGDQDGALNAYRKAMASGEPEYAAASAYNLATILSAVGNAPQARAAYEFAMAIQSEHRYRAAYNLGNLLLKEFEDETAAAAAFDVAIRGSDTEVVSKAAHNLGLIMEAEGRTQEAKKAFARAVEDWEGRAEQIKAAYQLGCILEQVGDLEEAIAFYRLASSGSGEAACRSLFNMGFAAKKLGDRDGAISAFREAASREGFSHLAAMAEVALGRLYEESGEISEARRAYRSAVSRGHAIESSNAAIWLGQLEEGP